MKRRRRLTCCVLACLLGVSAGCGDDAPIEHVPRPDGGKPRVFELGHVQVCPVTATGLPLLVRKVDAFARRHALGRHRIPRPGPRVVHVWTRGAPMRVHLAIERLHDTRYRIGLSTERGFDVDRVFVAAAAYDLCPHAADLPDAPLTATSGARAR